LRQASSNHQRSQEEAMSNCLTLLTEPLYSMIDLALDRPLAALAAVSGVAVLMAAALFASH
jgi:hypothetical protein